MQNGCYLRSAKHVTVKPVQQKLIYEHIYIIDFVKYRNFSCTWTLHISFHKCESDAKKQKTKKRKLYVIYTLYDQLQQTHKDNRHTKTRNTQRQQTHKVSCVQLFCLKHKQDCRSTLQTPQII